jgi:hypothetical protein
VRAGADLVIAEILQPQRMARLAEQHALNDSMPGSELVINALLERSSFTDTGLEGYAGAIREIVDWRILQGLFRLAADPAANEQVREDCYGAIEALRARLERPARRGSAHARAAQIEIRRFLERVQSTAPAALETVPPGSPIG